MPRRDITGDGDLTLKANNGGTLQFSSSGTINNTGTVTNAGAATTTVTIYKVGANVTSADLARHFPDFVRAYEPDGLSVDDFDTFPPTVRTLRQFVGSYHDLLHAVNDALLPNPDVKG